MKRTQTSNDANNDSRRSYMNSENTNYENYVSYAGYAGTTMSNMATTNINQPLPGQPPLPPMPPPSTAAVPPPPHMYPHGIASSVSPIQSWTHAPPFPPPWHWMMHQTAAQTAVPLPPQSTNTSSFYREMQPVRGNFSRRERLNQGWNNIYNVQRNNNFHRKNRRMSRTDQSQNPFDMDVYTMAAATNPNLLNNIAILLNNQRNQTNQPTNASTRTEETSIIKKKLKQRKPMSLSYPSRPWNREHAEKALSVEMEYNKKIKAQSLIIKFPDPDLNKDIVREFHSGILNIHFQSPSGPRYCFIQMAEDVNIDEAIEKLEKIQFGVGNLKVERKSLRDEDNTMPEEIDPYTLYIGNLPESVNVNEVKIKFPTAVRIDVGYAKKMRNTRYAFIRYNSVEDSIAAYKKVHDLMWDTRSIIVRFRRQHDNICHPGEPKTNANKPKDSPVTTPKASFTDFKNESQESNANSSLKSTAVSESTQPCNEQESSSAASADVIKSDAPSQSTPQQEKIIEKSSTEDTPPSQENNTVEEMDMLMEIKEEPKDYDEMDDIDDDDDDDDDNTDNVGEDDDDNVDGKWQILIPKIGPIQYIVSERRISSSDHLDKMFTDLENAVGDIDW